jgi:hypothetical protein
VVRVALVVVRVAQSGGRFVVRVVTVVVAKVGVVVVVVGAAVGTPPRSGASRSL